MLHPKYTQHQMHSKAAAPQFLKHLRLLRCLAAVALHGSAVRAADHMHVSQPAVTRGILELEQLCNVKLFERASRGMVPTKVGERMGQRAACLLEQLELGAAEAVALAGSQFRRVMPRRFAWTVPFASLRAFVTVASCSSEAKAAQQLDISQPAVHRAIRSLEDLAGVTLMQKSARGTWLTRAGEAMLRRVKLAYAEARAMEAELSAWSGSIVGRVAVGLLPLSSSVILPHAVEAVRGKYPGIRITLEDGTYETLLSQLLTADIDLIVGALRDTPTNEVTQVHLFDDELVVVARPGHPCLCQATSIDDLISWPWVTPLPTTPARANLDRAFSTQGLDSPEADVQANSSLMTLAMVLNGNRLGVLSRRQAEAAEFSGLVEIVPIAISSRRQIGATIRAAGEPSPDLQAMLNELHESAGTVKALAQP